MQPTEKQYWAGIKERYEKSQSSNSESQVKEKSTGYNYTKEDEKHDAKIDEQLKQKYGKANEKESSFNGLNTKEDYEHDIRWFEEMEKRYPTKGGLENNEVYKSENSFNAKNKRRFEKKYIRNRKWKIAF
jgi:hypothetical protein